LVPGEGVFVPLDPGVVGRAGELQPAIAIAIARHPRIAKAYRAKLRAPVFRPERRTETWWAAVHQKTRRQLPHSV